jgi:hypothetical protein
VVNKLLQVINTVIIEDDVRNTGVILVYFLKRVPRNTFPDRKGGRPVVNPRICGLALHGTLTADGQ